MEGSFMGIAIMVTSGKGGTGKTSLTAGVASCLAALGHRVLCIDLDIGLQGFLYTFKVPFYVLCNLESIYTGLLGY